MLQRSRAADTGQRILTFSLPLDWAGRASVVGNFNDWTPGALPLVAVGDVAEASVVLPDDYIAVFRYLGEGDHWFDEPEADYVDAGASVVLGVEPMGPDPDVAVAVAGGAAEEAEWVATPDPGASALQSPAERAVGVTDKKRRKADEKVARAVDRKRRKATDLTAKVKKADEKQRKAAERVAKEQAKEARKLAEKAEKKARKK